MGFTHYWRRNVIELDKGKWKKLIEDIEKVRNNMPDYFGGDGGYHKEEPIKIVGWDGKGKPDFNMEEIAFNGTKKNDLDHESFYIPRIYNFEGAEWKKKDWMAKHEIFNYCKTARKHYSFLAEVVLLLVSYHFDGNMKISSDGDEGDWKFAKDYFGKMFPKYAVVLRLS